MILSLRLGATSMLKLLLVTAVILTAARPSSAVTLLPGDILVGDQANDSIVRIDPVTGAQTVIAQGDQLNSPSGITMDLSGYILVADNANSRLVRIDPTDGSQQMIYQSAAPLVDLVLEDSTHALVAVGPLATFPNSVRRIDMVNQTEQVITFNNHIDDVTGIVRSDDGNVYVSEVVSAGGQNQNVGVVGVDPAGQQSVVSVNGNFRDPVDIVIEAPGSLLVLDSTAESIVRVNAASGAQSLVFSNAAFDLVSSLARESDGHLLVSDQLAAAVYRIDPLGGTMTTLTSGVNLSRPISLYVVVPVPTAVWSGLALLVACGLVRAWRRR